MSTQKGNKLRRLIEFLSPIGCGFIVALGTSAVIGIEKAVSLPGGSLSAGFTSGMVLAQQSGRWQYLIYGPVGGMVGFLIFCLMFNRS